MTDVEEVAKKDNWRELEGLVNDESDDVGYALHHRLHDEKLFRM